ncbi:LysR family transcriptional regulator [Verticiella sediminum]|uniref:LysR family transcriptional regulator n=1 Tax=Verticiella sediminum TaxID=1247510 RepID=A0A556AMT3_9BURK|nr:LysR family transcriptional regulator [Verticiella sediminum]TSH94202.1 LysR family transcriptional regulator [Verticiella sediminum]
MPATTPVRSVNQPAELRHLRCFISAVECGSMSRGALACDMSQPTFSTRIQQLEQGLGVRLLHRNGRGVVCTSAGQRLYERLKPVVAALDTALVEAAAADGKEHGEIVVGIVPTAAGRLSIPLMDTASRSDHPQLRVVESFSGHLQAWLAQGDIDIAVCSALPRQRGIRQLPLRSEPLQLVGLRQDAKTTASTPFATLQGVPLVLGSRMHAIRQIIQRVASRRGVTLNVAYEIDGLEAQLRFVLQGLGYAILPEGTLQPDAAPGLQCWTLTEPVVRRQLVVAVARDAEATKPAVRVVASRIAEMLR